MPHNEEVWQSNAGALLPLVLAAQYEVARFPRTRTDRLGKPANGNRFAVHDNLVTRVIRAVSSRAICGESLSERLGKCITTRDTAKSSNHNWLVRYLGESVSLEFLG